MTKLEFINEITSKYRIKTPGKCQLSGEKLDGQGYEIRIEHPEFAGKTIAVAVSKKVYLDWYNVAYPDAETPQI